MLLKCIGILLSPQSEVTAWPTIEIKNRLIHGSVEGSRKKKIVEFGHLPISGLLVVMSETFNFRFVSANVNINVNVN